MFLLSENSCAEINSSLKRLIFIRPSDDLSNSCVWYLKLFLIVYAIYPLREIRVSKKLIANLNVRKYDKTMMLSQLCNQFDTW